jgi:hypothetical protein
MRKALRPYMTAGVAVVGAGALAVAPVIATPPDVRIVNPAVHESGTALDSYVETVREALENLEALLGSALALPAPKGWTLELALGNLLDDPGGVALFVDELEAMGPVAGASVPVLLQNAAEAISATVEQAATGNVEMAVVSLIKTYVALAPAVTALVVSPLTLVAPELGEAASGVLATSVGAVLEPVLSGVGATGLPIQNVVEALDEAKPGSGAVFGALVAAPGTVLDGVLNGFTYEPDHLTLPGLLTAGDRASSAGQSPDPVAPVAGPALLPPSAAIPRPAGAHSVTLAVDDGPVDPDGGTNQTVAAERSGPAPSSTPEPGGRPFGANTADAPSGGARLAAVRQGVRAGMHEIRDGIRDVVKVVTGGNPRRASGSEVAGEAPAAQ